MPLTYRIPPGVSQTNTQGHPALLTEQGGKIILDHWMIDLWREANGQSLDVLLKMHSRLTQEPLLARAALACMAEAGLLYRLEASPTDPGKSETAGLSTIRPPTSSSLVSIIIVSHNSREWLADCLTSIHGQSYASLETIIVDNASQDGSAEWLSSRYGGKITILCLDQRHALSHAINRGVEAAKGSYYLLLNPDIVLAENAISALVSKAENKPNCAAIAAKLKFSWAPAFLNGLGNSVGAFSWGSDSALGYLDLGEFDHWDEIASACFAAALIPAEAWKMIGPLDEGFPLYYEDSEWCYRARLLGYSIYAAPQAVAYHAFGIRTPETSNGLTSMKLQYVIFGRLRFASKILLPRTLQRFMVNYALEDCLRFGFALARGRWYILRAYLTAWRDYIKSLTALQEQRRPIQNQRVLSDEHLLQLQRGLPMPLIRRGAPLLSRDIVKHHYLPLMLAGKTRALPELNGLSASASPQDRMWQRAIRIYQEEGLEALYHRIGRQIAWRLSQP